MTEAVAVPDAGGVPDLVRPPALEIGPEDVALPRIYLGQYLSEAVANDLVEPGSVFAAAGKDDPSPNLLWNPKKEGENPGVVFHVLSLRKGKSIAVDGELQTFGPGGQYPIEDAPKEAWTTYNYVVVLPEVDQDVPYKLLLTRTGRPSALQINTVLKKSQGVGPAWNSAFTLMSQFRENTKGKFFVPVVRPVDADPKNIEVAEQLAIQIAGSTADIQSTGEEPAI